MVLVVTLSKGSIFKGMISTGTGLLLFQVGFAPVCAISRFTFESYQFAGSFTLVCVMMGPFAGRVIILEYALEKRMGKHKKIKASGFVAPFKNLIRNKMMVLRSFFVGSESGSCQVWALHCPMWWPMPRHSPLQNIRRSSARGLLRTI